MNIQKVTRMILKAAILTVLVPDVAIATAKPTKVIYGDDNRYDVSDHPNPRLVELASSVAGQVANDRLFSLDADFFSFPLITLESEGICSSERFSKQKKLPRCTGFLVAKDLLVTAGHCMTSVSECRNFKWVFSYTNDKSVISKKNVYSCKKVIGHRFSSSRFTTKDYAIIQLDRAVTGRKPLKLKMKGNPRKGTEIAVIGHPSGLPLKITDGAYITQERVNFFRANLDTYGGNSGSPVFDVNTGEVLGILVEGADDYIKLPGDACKVSNRLSMDSASEKVFKIKKVKKLKKLLRRLLK